MEKETFVLSVAYFSSFSLSLFLFDVGANERSRRPIQAMMQNKN